MEQNRMPGNPSPSDRAPRSKLMGLSWDHGEVVDLSETGAQLRCDGSTMKTLYKGEVREITVRSDFEMLRLRAQVAWIRREGMAAKSYVVGVRFVGLTAAQRGAVAAFGRNGFVGGGDSSGPEPFRFESSDESARARAEAVEAAQRTIAGIVDLYAMLGAKPGDGEDAIRAAYRAQAARWHPDHCREPEAAAKFDQITKAYQLLRDPARRAKYDALVRTSLSEALGPPPAHRPASRSDRRDGPRMRTGAISSSLGPVLDASNSGLRVETSARGLKPGKSIAMWVAADDRALELTARVQWVRPAGLGKKQAGLRVEFASDGQRASFGELVRADLRSRPWAA